MYVFLVTSRSIFKAIWVPGPAAGLGPKSLTSPVSPSVTRQRVLPARMARGRPPRACPCCGGFKKHTLVCFSFFYLILWKLPACNLLCVLLFSPQLEAGSDEERKLNVR